MKNNYDAVIPTTVRYDKDLVDGAKLLYGEISALANRCGYCTETNRYFAEAYGVSTNAVRRWIGQLVEKEYIDSIIVFCEGTKQVKERQLYPNRSEETTENE